MDETTEDGWPFPSPCGEKVGINDGEIHNGEYVRVMFPSPCGEKVGINDGFTQSQVDWMLQFPSPCGEKVGINIKDGFITISFYIPVFPSPCGEKVGINPGCSFFPDKGGSYGFRPLAGKR